MPDDKEEPHKHRHVIASDIERMNSDGTNTTAREVWTDQTGNPMPTVTLTLGQSTEADSSGRVPMWIGSHVSFPDRTSTELTPGSLILWEIVNRTPLTHTLYFHRVFLEVRVFWFRVFNLLFSLCRFVFSCVVIAFRVVVVLLHLAHPDSFLSGQVFEWETRDSDGVSQTVKRVERDDPNNGHFIGVTVPAENRLEGTYSTIRCVSKTPRLTAGKEQPGGTSLHRWNVRVQSTTLDHVPNGMSCRLMFNVLPVGDEENSEESPSGIDFSVRLFG